MTMLLALLLTTVAAAQSLDSICHAVSNVADCRAVLTLPTGASVKTCRTESFKVVECKTQSTVWVQCPTWREPFRQCPETICVPGTESVWAETPCGVEVNTKDIDICQAAREAIPGIPDLLEKSAGACTCLPQVLKLAAESEGILDERDLTAASGELLKLWGDANQCFADNAFEVKDNKGGLTLPGGALHEDESVVLFKAQEIDLSTYTQLATLIASCFLPSGCNTQLIESFFTQYLTDSERLMAQQVRDFLSPFQTALKDVKGTVEGVQEDMGAFPESVDRTAGEVKEIVQGVCRNATACVEAGFKRLTAKVEESLQFAADLARIQGTFGKAIQSANEITKSVDTAVEAFTSLGDLGVTGIVQLILSGKISKVEDVGQLFQVAKRLPTLFKDIQAVIPTIQSTAQDLQTRAPKLGEILESSWVSESAPVEEAIEAIQASIRKNLLDKVDAIVSKSNHVMDTLNGLISRGTDVTLDIKVASYQRWSDISLDMPCSRTGRKEYEIAGFRTSFDYPEFYSCPYANRIPFPNHHIPYIKLHFKNNKRSLREPSAVNHSSLLATDPFPLGSAAMLLAREEQRTGFALALACAVAVACLAYVVYETRRRRLARSVQSRDDSESAEKTLSLA